jgi:hypothetical protein
MCHPPHPGGMDGTFIEMKLLGSWLLMFQG